MHSIFKLADFDLLLTECLSSSQSKLLLLLYLGHHYYLPHTCLGKFAMQCVCVCVSVCVSDGRGGGGICPQILLKN